MLNKSLKSTSKTECSSPGLSQTGLGAPIPRSRCIVLALITPLHALSHRSSLIARRLDRLVLDTLEPLPGDRKCFRMINGVLVERTVKDVVPALRTNAEGLKKVLDDLVKQYKTKQDELEKWKVCGECLIHIRHYLRS